ncbi:MAG: J domain-containing protein [Actinomycetota bacterium]
MARTHYEVLDVAADAQQAEVRKAYHRAARQWHPDRYAGRPPAEAARAEAHMRRLNQAWEVLGDVERRKRYDVELRRASGSTSRPARPMGGATVPDDDGVIRIDPRLLDPSFLAARRHVQSDEISNRTSFILRVAPVVALLGLLGAIFVFTAYARDGAETAVTTTVPGPRLGAGIEANDCVSVLTGPSLLERPCGPTADGRVIGARLPDGVCPAGTVREVELSNGAIACLGPVA